LLVIAFEFTGATRSFKMESTVLDHQLFFCIVLYSNICIHSAYHRFT